MKLVRISCLALGLISSTAFASNDYPWVRFMNTSGDKYGYSDSIVVGFQVCKLQNSNRVCRPFLYFSQPIHNNSESAVWGVKLQPNEFAYITKVYVYNEGFHIFTQDNPAHPPWRNCYSYPNAGPVVNLIVYSQRKVVICER